MKSILIGAMLALTIPAAAQPVPPALAVQALQACLYSEGLQLIGRMTLPEDVAALVQVRCKEQIADYGGSPNGGFIMRSFLTKYTAVHNELSRRR
jgi:hypothetical protein